jgi:SRSO17 transposase
MSKILAQLVEKLPQHLTRFAPFFQAGNQSAQAAAAIYLYGLCAATKANLLSMSERLSDTDHQRLQHMVTHSPWDFEGLVQAVGREVSGLIGGKDAALIIDESGFTKKGAESVGVARQYNGRLGKVDNCQVGVFAALAQGQAVSLIDARLFLPEGWVRDPTRLKRAGVPETVCEAKSKVAIARDLIVEAKRNGVRFGHVVFDALYGSAGWLLRELDDEGICFVGEVRSNQPIYRRDPIPTVRQKTSALGRTPTRPRTNAQALSVTTWLGRQPASAWRQVRLRDAEKGPITIEAQSARVWLWDGKESKARCWLLVARREIGRPETVKFSLSNAPARTSLKRLRHARPAILGRTRLSRGEGRLGYGSIPGAPMARLASSHGLGAVGDELLAEGATAPPRRLQRSHALRARVRHRHATPSPFP